MSNKLTKKTTTFRQTDKNKSLYIGVLLLLFLTITPFLFYTYKFAPDSKEWNTLFGTINSGSFPSVSIYLHVLFTKLILVLLTGIWFLTSNNWWKYGILVPFTMFLFQLSGVLNHKISYIDEYDFWYSLPFILPIVFFLVYISFRIKRRASSYQLKDEVDNEIKNILSDSL